MIIQNFVKEELNRGVHNLVYITLHSIAATIWHSKHNKKHVNKSILNPHKIHYYADDIL